MIVSLDDRLDQTLGKPGIWMVSSEKERQRMTIMARLARVEIQVRHVTFMTVELIETHQ